MMFVLGRLQAKKALMLQSVHQELKEEARAREEEARTHEGASIGLPELPSSEIPDSAAQGTVIAPRISSVLPEPAENLFQRDQQPSQREQNEQLLVSREQLLAWLNDAFHMEKLCVQVLENHTEDLEQHPDLHRYYAAHLERTRMHADRMRECVERLGGSVSTAKTAADFFTRVLQSRSTGVSPDEAVKNLLSDYSAQRLQIAFYKVLITASRVLGEIEVVRICEPILREDEDVARWLEETIPSVVIAYMGQGDPSRVPAPAVGLSYEREFERE